MNRDKFKQRILGFIDEHHKGAYRCKVVIDYWTKEDKGIVQKGMDIDSELED